jgi:hypothetical protein
MGGVTLDATWIELAADTVQFAGYCKQCNKLPRSIKQ